MVSHLLKTWIHWEPPAVPPQTFAPEIIHGYGVKTTCLVFRTWSSAYGGGMPAMPSTLMTLPGVLFRPSSRSMLVLQTGGGMLHGFFFMMDHVTHHVTTTSSPNGRMRTFLDQVTGARRWFTWRLEIEHWVIHPGASVLVCPLRAHGARHGVLFAPEQVGV